MRGCRVSPSSRSCQISWRQTFELGNAKAGGLSRTPARYAVKLCSPPVTSICVSSFKSHAPGPERKPVLCLINGGVLPSFPT